jgi:hypothetical protein
MILQKKRFEFFVKKFRNNPTLFREYKDYKAVIEEYLQSGIVQIVEPQDVNSANGNLTYYLPHHPVIRKGKQTTKLRIVFDASALSPSQLSLNDVLLPGPNLNPDLSRTFRCNSDSKRTRCEIKQIMCEPVIKSYCVFVVLTRTKNGKFTEPPASTISPGV